MLPTSPGPQAPDLLEQEGIRTLRKLGEGWLGPTYLAEEGPGAQKVVVKIVAPSFLRAPGVRTRIAALGTTLPAPLEEGLVEAPRYAGREGGPALLITPFIEGENLAGRLAGKPGETVAQGLWIVRELARILSAAHGSGLRHLALRPTQVLIQNSPQSERGLSVHLLGVGVAEALGLARPGACPEARAVYLAPEQLGASPASPPDERADVYALGVLLLSLLLGKQPSREEVQQCRGDAEKFLAGRVIRDDTARLVKRMLASDPGQRAKMGEVVAALGVESQAALLGATLAPVTEEDPALLEADAVAEEFAKTDVAPTPVAGSLPPIVQSKAGKTGESSTQHKGLLFGNFRIVRRIGQGGMGVVYEAEHKQIGRRAAVKVLHPRFAQNAGFATRFLNEARAVNIVRHPGLVEIFEYGQQPDGTLYIVMEYLPGESLRTRLEKRKDPYPITQITDWATQMARALSATHAKGIIHRDLKPENVMILPDPLRAGQEWVKVLDFGIAKVGAPASAPVGEAVLSDTASGTVMGTPLYMAPEQHSGAEVVDGLADVFTFGVMLYEMLAGKRPYKDSALNLLTVPAPPLQSVRSEIPKELAVLVHRMLALVPAERPQMAEVEARLIALAGRDRNRRRNRVLLLCGGLVALLAVVSGVAAYRMRRPLSLAESRERALLQIKKSLASAELNEELQAAVALGRSRDIEYRPLLEPLLAEKQAALSAAAARGLGEMSAIESQPVLLALLTRSPDVAVRLEAATALAQLSHPRGVETLRSLLQQGDDLTRVEAALRLLALGDRSGAPLLHRATERDDGTSERAVPVLVALARVGDAQAKQQLMRLFQNAVSSGKEAPLVAYGLARIGEPAAYKELVRLAASSGPEVVVAARFLSALGQPDGYPVLIRVGADDGSTERLREIAFDGLGDSGRTEAAAVIAKTLSEAAASKRLRLAAAGSILQLAAGAVGVYASRSLSWARAAVGSDSGSTRELAVMLLGDLENDETIPVLRLALKDKEVEVRHGAARALGHKSVRAALAALVDALDDSERDVRTAGMQSIGQVVAALRRRGERNFENEVTVRLQQMLEKGSAIDRIVAGGTLLRMGDASQRGLLQEGLRSAEPLARRLALELLDAEASVLVQALGDGDRLVRLAAARRLAGLGSREGIEVLLSALREGGPDGLVAYALLKKLGQIVEPPADLLTLFTGRLLREKESILDSVPELPVPVALQVLLVATNDASNMVRRRAAEIAHGFYVRTLQTGFRNLLLELRNDPDIVVRARAVELVAALPAGEPASVPSAGPSPAAPSSQPAPPPPVEPVRTDGPLKSPSKGPSKGPSKNPSKAKAPVRLEDDPRSKTMGLIQIYVMKNGRCQLANQYFLPPGDHIINVGKQSQTVSVYAGTTVPIRQCQ